MSSTLFGLKDDILERIEASDTNDGLPLGCKYTVIEGKDKESHAEIPFDALEDVRVNASFVKIQCSKQPHTYFVTLPYRSNEVAAEKSKIKLKQQGNHGQRL